jgi:hypothetical protein
MVGLGEWILNPPRRLRSLFWIMIFTAGVALVVPTLEGPANRMVSIPMGHGAARITNAEYLLHWPLIAVLTWLAIPAAARLSNEQNRTGKWVWVIATAACAAWFIVFFHIIVYRLASRSLAHGWPFDQNYALSLLQTRRDIADDITLWRVVESADWARKPNPYRDDYLQRCIRILAEHNRAGTAAHLSSLLRQRPSSLLADDAAPILAEEHRYETSPELMRYALLDAGEVNPAENALESMHIPQAALAIFREQALLQFVVYGTPETSGSLIETDNERRLVNLLGKDVGPKWGDWVRLYDQGVDQLPTPLSADQASEINRVVLAITKYWSTQDRLQRAGSLQSIAAPNFDVSGADALEHEISKYQRAANSLMDQ